MSIRHLKYKTVQVTRNEPDDEDWQALFVGYDGRIVAGKGTVGDELIRRAGGVNAAGCLRVKTVVT